MPAIGDVARLAGVSKSTASRALSGRGYVAEETRLRVEEAAQRIGYIASPDAASLVTGRTKNVGVVIPFVNRWFFGEVLEGAERALLSAGYWGILWGWVPALAWARMVRRSGAPDDGGTIGAAADRALTSDAGRRRLPPVALKCAPRTGILTACPGPKR